MPREGFHGSECYVGDFQVLFRSKRRSFLVLSCGCIEILYCLYLVCITRRPFKTSQSKSCSLHTYHTTAIYLFVHAECGGDALMTGLTSKPFLEVCMILHHTYVHVAERARPVARCFTRGTPKICSYPLFSYCCRLHNKHRQVERYPNVTLPSWKRPE